MQHSKRLFIGFLVCHSSYNTHFLSLKQTSIAHWLVIIYSSKFKTWGSKELGRCGKDERRRDINFVITIQFSDGIYPIKDLFVAEIPFSYIVVTDTYLRTLLENMFGIRQADAKSQQRIECSDGRSVMFYLDERE